MGKHTIILATTGPRPDGDAFTHEALLNMAADINQRQQNTHHSQPKPLPFFEPRYNVKAWVSIPEPGGPAVLYAEGYLTDAFVNALNAAPGGYTFVVGVVRKGAQQ